MHGSKSLVWERKNEIEGERGRGERKREGGEAERERATCECISGHRQFYEEEAADQTFHLTQSQ